MGCLWASRHGMVSHLAAVFQSTRNFLSFRWRELGGIGFDSIQIDRHRIGSISICISDGEVVVEIGLLGICSLLFDTL